MGSDCSGNSVCSFRRWPDTDIFAGIMLYAFGSKPDAAGVMPELEKNALTYALSYLEEQIQALILQEGAEDLNYASAKLCEAMNAVNARLIQAADTLGVGIYLGGAIVYGVHRQLLCLPFGGTCVYACKDRPVPLRVQEGPKALIQDALGVTPAWRPAALYRDGTDIDRLLIFSELPPNMKTVEKILQDTASQDTQANTAALLLRQELSAMYPDPQAVFDIYV